MRYDFEVEILGSEPPFKYSVYRKPSNSARHIVSSLSGEADSRDEAIFEAAAKARAYQRTQDELQVKEVVPLFTHESKQLPSGEERAWDLSDLT